MGRPLDHVTASPLTWPDVKPRTAPSDRQWGPFRVSAWSVDRATKTVLHELDLMGVGDWHVIVSTNLSLRLDGLPRSNQKQPDDPGASVWFMLDDEPHVIACDQYTRVEINLRAISKHIEAIRGIDRWGCGDLRQAFAGWKALPEAEQAPAERAWWNVFGWSEDLADDADADDVRRAYRHLALERHPDSGGTHEAFVELQAALHEALELLGAS